MTLRVTNATFESVSEGEFSSAQAAYQAAIVSAVAIAGNEITAGAPAAIVEIVVEGADADERLRGAVAISTARILETTGDREQVDR